MIEGLAGGVVEQGLSHAGGFELLRQIGIEFIARKQFSNTFWAQASYLYSSLRGNYSGAIREASGQTDPGINADYDYNQFLINAYGRLQLDRPHQVRIDAVYNAPFGLAVGFQGYVRSGQPKNNLGYYNSFYPDLLYLSQRGYAGREPTEYEANLSLGYNLVIGPVTITPQLYVFNVLNRQAITQHRLDIARQRRLHRSRCRAAAGRDGHGCALPGVCGRRPTATAHATLRASPHYAL